MPVTDYNSTIKLSPFNEKIWQKIPKTKKVSFLFGHLDLTR